MLITQVEGEKNTAQSKVQATVVELVNKAKAKSQAQVTEAKQRADVEMIQAESKLQATRALYAALAEEGRAEGANLEAFDAQRRHEYEMKKAVVFEELAKSQRNIVVSGETGENIISQLISMSTDGSFDKKKK